MSFSLALVPVALALRTVMGKDNFQQWVESIHVKVPTSFTDESDLVRTVKLAGLDADKFGGVRKTHIPGTDRVVLWELVDGTWMAVFAKADGEEFARDVMRTIEQTTGRHIFGPEADFSPTHDTESYPTNFRDEALLLQTLRDFGVDRVEGTDGIIACELGSSMVRFRPAVDGPYSVEIEKTPDLPAIFQQLSVLDGDYKRCVQAMVYEKLKSRIADQQLSVESEEVLEDNSILITLTVPD